VPWLALVLGVALLWRGALMYSDQVVMDRPFLVADAQDYHRRADNLLRHGVYSRQSAPPLAPDAKRTPGYPLYLAAFYAVLGPEPVWPIIFQILISLGIISLVFVSGNRAYGWPAGAWAGGLLAVDATHAVFAQRMMTETLTCLWLTLAVFALWSAFATDSRAASAAGGVTLGLAALTRPTFLFLLPVLAVVLLARHWRERAPGWLWPAAILLVAGLLTISPWVARNWAVWGIPAFTSVTGEAAYKQAAHVEAAATGTSWEDARQAIESRVEHRLSDSDWDQFANSSVLRDEAVRIVWAHPLVTAALWLRGMAWALLDISRARLLAALPAPAGTIAWVVAQVIWLGTLVLAVRSLADRGLRGSPVTVICLTVIAYTLVAAGIWGYGRYRMPADPAIVLLAGAAAARMIECRRRGPSADE